MLCGFVGPLEEHEEVLSTAEKSDVLFWGKTLHACFGA
jgi:hypothetical protein